MRPLIGITTGEIRNLHSPWSPITYGQSHTYSDAIVAAGGTPVLIPITSDAATLKDIYSRLDGILFAGGNDINPKLYDALVSPHTKDVSRTRDANEVLLMEQALIDDKPVLAICRGMHLLNALSGGTLYQDIPTEIPNASDHDLSSLRQDREHIAHILKVDPDSRMARIIGATDIKANTHHHQAIKELGSSLTAVAWAEDGIVEAIENNNSSYTIGIQCHPESLHAPEPKWGKVFESFIQAAGRNPDARS